MIKKDAAEMETVVKTLESVTLFKAGNRENQGSVSAELVVGDRTKMRLDLETV